LPIWLTQLVILAVLVDHGAEAAGLLGLTYDSFKTTSRTRVNTAAQTLFPVLFQSVLPAAGGLLPDFMLLKLIATGHSLM